jgi:COP9 signalosome complex subunit 7
MTTLECPTIRALEDLIIDGVYAGVLQARLDQRAQRVEVEYTLGRDISPDKVGQLLASLQDWYYCPLLSFIPHTNIIHRSRATSSVLETLDSKINTLRAEKAAADEVTAQRQQLIDKRIKEINEKREKGLLGKPGAKGTRSTPMVVGDENDMDVDEEIGKGKGKKGGRESESKGFFGNKLMKRNVNRF